MRARARTNARTHVHTRARRVAELEPYVHSQCQELVARLSEDFHAHVRAVGQPAQVKWRGGAPGMLEQIYGSPAE